MTSAARILANANNLVPAASASASSVLAASETVFRRPGTRAGNGAVVLSGGYTGAADATVEVEIVTPAGSKARVTQPVFAGAGNGTMTPPAAADGTASQDVTVTLYDLGTETLAAQLVVYGDILLRAKTPGAAGNALVLTVEPALTLSATPIGALSTALAKDTQEWTDQRHDFGAVPLMPDGTVPTTAPRLVFGRDTSRVYRHYKRWDGDQWQYGISPKLAADHVAGATVHSVGGTYSVTVTDGATPETTAATTLYDFLIALDASALVEVAGAVGNDRRPGGIAAVDLPIRTAAFALPVVASAPERMLDLIDLTVADAAPSETVTLTCTANAPVGAEIWQVKSKVAGAMKDATTGVPYTDSPYVGFTIPVIPLTETPIAGRIAITARRFPRPAGSEADVPAICLWRPILGAKAANKTLTLVWTQRPDSDCDCAKARVTGLPSEVCLGITLEGDTAMSALPAGQQARLEDLEAWYSGFVAGNTVLTAAGELRAASIDIELAGLARSELLACLTDLYADGKLTESVWMPAHAYAKDAVVEPTARNGYRYRCTVAGTTHASTQPTWPTVIGDTITDSGVTWKCVSKIPEYAWDDLLVAVGSGLTALATLGTAATVTSAKALDISTAYTTGDVVWAQDGDTLIFALCTASGTTANPISPTPKLGWPPITSGTATFLGISAAEAFARLVGDTEDANSTASDSSDPGIVRDPTTFAEKYRAACDVVRALAGILPKAEASTPGSECWRDPGDSGYWEFQDSDYLPAFNNRYYHSVIERPNPETGRPEIVSTYEFGFGLQVDCAGSLQFGDQLVITISDVTATYPYQVGDAYQIPLVAGGPLAFSGGQDGTDTLTWSVLSSTAGALDDYELDDDEDPYSDGGLSFTLHRGALAFALGDAFTFSVEAGGKFRWRKDAGSWSSDTAIADSVALGEGLSAAFVDGAAPSFVEDDSFTFSVGQPNAVDHVASPHGECWRWSGASATLTLTWGSDQTVSAVGLLRHELAAGAAVSIVLKNSGGSTLATVTPTVGDGPLVTVLPATLTTVRSLVVTLSTATGMGLGWLYAGVPLGTSHHPETLRVSRGYALTRGGGANPRGSYLGRGQGGEIAWKDWLTQADLDALLAVIDDAKAAGDAPVVVLPHVLHPADAILARIDGDRVEIEDLLEFQPNDSARRRLSLTLPLAPVYQ
ncbi:MAG: hypothetical protein U1F59_09660 [Candidatus Competibacteraceae bacterium]